MIEKIPVHLLEDRTQFEIMKFFFDSQDWRRRHDHTPHMLDLLRSNLAAKAWETALNVLAEMQAAEITHSKTDEPTNEMNATSPYDLLYKGLSDEDRERMEKDFSALMEKAIEEATPNFQKAIKEAAVRLTDAVGFWGDWVRDNNTRYDFMRALSKQIWDSMLNMDPKEVSEWDIRKLVESWRKKYPEQFAEIVNAETLRELEETKKHLEFERQCNRRY